MLEEEEEDEDAGTPEGAGAQRTDPVRSVILMRRDGEMESRSTTPVNAEAERED